MKIKRLLACILTIIMLTTMVVNIAVADDATNKKIVRVAAFSVQHLQEKNEDGEYIGYAYDYLRSLLPYTNWEYEFVEGSLAECMEWLKTGEIDLMGCMIKTPERQELYDFTDYYSEYNGTKLLVKNENTKYAANDFESFEGIVVGIQNGSALVQQLTEFAEQKDFSVTLKYYDTESQILEALENETIDAACLSALKVDDWTRVIATFDIHPYFAAVTKGNTELLDELNKAIGQKKNDDPMFEETLRRQYHVNESKNSVIFTAAEKEYIANAEPITVAYDSNFVPIEGFDTKTNQPYGYTFEVLNRISEITGLEFNYVTADSYSNAIKLLIDQDADILSSFTKSLLEISDDRVSNFYINLSVVLVGKSDFHLNTQDEIRIAVPIRATQFVTSMQKSFPNCTFLYYESGKEAYESVVQGVADLVIRNIYSAQLDIATDYSDLRIIYDLNQNAQSKFLFAEDEPQELRSIFNKCIASFTEAEISAMMMRATIERIDTSSQTMRVILIGLLAIVLAAFAIWLFLRLKNARRRLFYTAFFDELTGLPNLTKFKIEAQKILEENPKRAHAILLTDIADFSFINEKYGFDIGNLVIQSVGKSLTNLKAHSTLTARVSSNMFIHLYVYNETEEKFLTTNEALHSFTYQNTSIQFFHYFGRYLIPLGETDVNAIFEKASYAHLFAKKNSIKDRIVDYDDEAKRISVRNQEIESKMDNALKQNDFKVYLQAKYKCDGKTLVGAEALVRWYDSTTNQMIFPNDFIPLFERNGFVKKLDFYMFEEVCKLLSDWKQNGLDMVCISVNFSRLHFSNPTMADELLAITQKYDVDKKYLEIEITENALSTEIDEISSMIKKLSDHGFKISLDDFSSQHSSLLFLAQVPVDVVKLDKSFVSAITENNVSRLLVDGTIKILKQLNFTVVAEGVETPEQVTLLDEMNCDIIQGYIFAKPNPAEEVTKLLLASNNT